MTDAHELRRRWLVASGVCPPLASRALAPAPGGAPVSDEGLPDASPVPDANTSGYQDAGGSAVSGAVSLEALREQARDCRACRLAESRTQVVFGVGCTRPSIVFIGEAPGRDEDLKGEPFVGRAGRLLDRMLAAIGLDRDAVYIMNTVKCRPPGNRDPRPDEIAACRRWFDPQLELLSPSIICLLGRVAAQTVLETDAPLAALRGRWHEVRGIRARVTYHPAYLLRSARQKERSWQDLRAIARALSELQEASRSD
ncbi:MAG: uracil-DNA glycosylase [Mariprofundaceae bacterium]